MTPGTIAAAAAALRAGTVSSAALVEASLAAIDRHQSATNAFITVDPQGARAAAAAVDAERARGVDRGPLHGIPISLKDLIDQQGLVTSAASRVLATNVAAADAPLVSRLKDAGRRHSRAHEPARVRARDHERGLRFWVRAPSKGSASIGWRIERRLRRGRRERHGARVDWHRHGRLRPNPGGVLRPGRPQAWRGRDLDGRRRAAVDHARSRRPSREVGAGRRVALMP
jgi:hypothetical protein